MLRKKVTRSRTIATAQTGTSIHPHPTHTHTHYGWPDPLRAQASHTQNANCRISSRVARSRVSMMSHFVTAPAGGFLLPCGFFLIGRSARYACGTRAVRRCHLQRARRVHQCRQCRGGGRSADARAGGMRRDRKRRSTGACDSTICSASVSVGEPVGLVCTRLRLPVRVALHSLRSIAVRRHLKKVITATGLPSKARRVGSETLTMPRASN